MTQQQPNEKYFEEDFVSFNNPFAEGLLEEESKSMGSPHISEASIGFSDRQPIERGTLPNDLEATVLHSPINVIMDHVEKPNMHSKRVDEHLHRLPTNYPKPAVVFSLLIKEAGIILFKGLDFDFDNLVLQDNMIFESEDGEAHKDDLGILIDSVPHYDSTSAKENKN